MFMPALAKLHLAHHTHFHNPLSFVTKIWWLRLHPNAKPDRPIVRKGLEIEENVITSVLKFFLYNLECDFPELLECIAKNILEQYDQLSDFKRIHVNPNLYN